MLFLRITILSLLIAGGLQVRAQQFTDPVAFNDHIVELQNEVGIRLIAFNEALILETSTKESVEPYYLEIVRAAGHAVDQVKQLPLQQSDSAFHKAALDLFTFYQRCFTIEYRELINLIFNDELTEADYNMISTILTNVSAEEAIYDLAFQNAQIAFAQRHNITLGENALQKSIDQE